MTVNKLHKLLGELIAKGHGHKPVCIDKETFYSPLEADGAVIMAVENVRGPIFIAESDDWGGTKTNADGTESGRMTVILEGNSHD